MSREQSSRPNFASSTGSSGRGGRNRPNNANNHYRSSRGGRRGRGGITARPAHDALPEADIKEGLDTTKVIKTMVQPTRPSAPEDFPIENVKYVASYNWIDEEKPTIAVPGATLFPPHQSMSNTKLSFRFTGHMDGAYCPIHAGAR